MMEMISEKFYGTSEATEEILEPEEQTLAHVLEEIHARIWTESEPNMRLTVISLIFLVR